MINVFKGGLGFIIAFAVVTLGTWLGGFNFDRRGSDMQGWFFAATAVGIVGSIVSCNIMWLKRGE